MAGINLTSLAKWKDIHQYPYRFMKLIQYFFTTCGFGEE